LRRSALPCAEAKTEGQHKGCESPPGDYLHRCFPSVAAPLSCRRSAQVWFAAAANTVRQSRFMLTGLVIGDAAFVAN
jgi:hypothetical protein